MVLYLNGMAIIVAILVFDIIVFQGSKNDKINVKRILIGYLAAVFILFLAIWFGKFGEIIK